MTEQEKLLSQEEIKRKLAATNALVTGEELRKLRDRRNRGVKIEAIETSVSVDNPTKTYTRNKSYTFVLKDVGVHFDPQTGNQYLIHLIDPHDKRYFTRMRWVRKGQIEGRMENFLHEGTINKVVFMEGIESEDTTLWLTFPLWEFKNPGVFLEKGGNYKGDDFNQALPLLRSFPDLKL